MSKKKSGDVIKNIGAILAVPLILIQLWDWATAPTDKLEATLKYSVLEYPPTYMQAVDALGEYKGAEELRKLAGLDESFADDNLTLERVVDAALRQLYSEVRFDESSEPFSDLSDSKGVYFIQVINNGSAALSNVQLTHSEAMLVEIRRPGSEATTERVRELIDLGTLQPKASVSLTVWSSRTPTEYQAESIRLTHKEGIGEVDIYSPASAFDRSLREWFNFGVFMLIVLLFSSLLLWPLLMSTRVTVDREMSKQSKIAASTSEEPRILVEDQTIKEVTNAMDESLAPLPPQEA